MNTEEKNKNIVPFSVIVPEKSIPLKINLGEN